MKNRAAVQESRNKNEAGVRQRILRSAVALFAQKGYAATSVREIVTRAGVTKPALYYYFGSKEGLFKSIMTAVAERQVAVMESALNHHGSSAERLRYFYHALIEAAKADHDVVRMMYAILFGPEEGIPEFDVEEIAARLKESIRGIYTEGVARGEFGRDDPELVAMLIMSVLDTAIVAECVRPRLGHAATVNDILELLLQGLMKRKS